ncbi:hypothetical protein ES703_14684 [subsurface metagenome]
MSRGHRKTRDFKDRQCRYCELADKLKLRRGESCCPLPNPKIRNGHCIDPKPMEVKVKRGGKTKSDAAGRLLVARPVP